jgi:hypothetical protein
VGGGRALPLVALLAACPQEEGLGAFQVVYSRPAEGDFAGPESRVELGFSRAIDRESCTPETLHLAALAPDGAVAWFEVTTLEAEEVHDRWELVHGTLTPGLDHLLAVQSGPDGCLATNGDEIEPFSAVFPVVEASR